MNDKDITFAGNEQYQDLEDQPRTWDDVWVEVFEATDRPILQYLKENFKPPQRR